MRAGKIKVNKPEKCILCGKPSEMDVCVNCARLMKKRGVRRKIYDIRYNQYSVDHGKMSYRFLNEFVNSGTKCLELGAGAGHLSDYCSNLSSFVVTTDFSATMAHRAKETYPHLMVCIADAESSIPFKDSSFDVVISAEVFEYLYDISDHLLEVNKILKNNGVYAIKTPNKLFDVSYRIFDKKSRYYYEAFHHSTQNYMALKKLLRRFGFTAHFLHITHLSDTQKKKINSNFIKNIIEFFLPIVPAFLQPNFICIAKNRTTSRQQSLRTLLGG